MRIKHLCIARGGFFIWPYYVSLVLLLTASSSIVLFYMPEASSSQKIVYREIADPIAFNHPISGQRIENTFSQITDINNSSDANVVKLKTIYYRQTGGIGGVDNNFEVDVNSLTNNEAVEVQNIIDETGFFSLEPESIQGISPDNYNFTVTVETEDGKHTVLRHAPNPGSTELKPLINWINRICIEYGEKECKQG